MTFWAGTLKRIWQAVRREDGTASIEFVILFPPIMILFLSSFEVSVLMLRSTIFEKAMSTTVRELRLGIVNPKTAAELKSTLCARAALLPECMDSMKVELVPISTTSWTFPSAKIQCIDKEANINPAVTVNFGQANDLMLVRACAKVDPFFVSTPWVMDLLPVDGAGEYAVVAASSFVNEP